MRRAWKYRLYPTPKQEIRLLDTLAACRDLYNTALEDRRTLWKAHRKSTGFTDQSKYLPKLKSQPDESLHGVNAQVLQDVLHRLDKAFAAFFRRCKERAKKKGYPRFKARHRYNSFTYPQYPSGAVVVETKKRHDLLRLHKVGDVPIMLHRPVEGTIKTCAIVRDVGRWYAVLTTENGAAPAPVPLGPGTKAVGVDLGLTHLLMLSTGGAVGNPRLFRKSEAKVRRFGRRLSRTERRSMNRGKARVRLAKAHQKVREQRRDFVHKTAKTLVDEFDVVAFERLKVRNMVKNRHLSKSISDAGWGQLVSVTASKAEGAGKTVVLVEPAGTTIECSVCGTAVPKPLSERTHSCPSCGLVMDRDLNAARNVLRWGMALLSEASHSEQPAGSVPSRVGREPPEHTPVEMRPLAGGHSAPGQVASSKQEATDFSRW